MPRLSDVLKNKNHGETPWEKQQRLKIEDEIAAQAIIQEEAALEAEKENEMLDIVTSLEEDPYISDIPSSQQIKQHQPPTRNKGKKRQSLAEKRAKAAERMRKKR